MMGLLVCFFTLASPEPFKSNLLEVGEEFQLFSQFLSRKCRNKTLLVLLKAINLVSVYLLIFISLLCFVKLGLFVKPALEPVFQCLG